MLRTNTKHLQNRSQMMLEGNSEEKLQLSSKMNYETIEHEHLQMVYEWTLETIPNMSSHIRPRKKILRAVLNDLRHILKWIYKIF